MKRQTMSTRIWSKSEVWGLRSEVWDLRSEVWGVSHIWCSSPRSTTGVTTTGKQTITILFADTLTVWQLINVSQCFRENSPQILPIRTHGTLLSKSLKCPIQHHFVPLPHIPSGFKLLTEVTKADMSNLQSSYNFSDSVRNAFETHLKAWLTLLFILKFYWYSRSP